MKLPFSRNKGLSYEGESSQQPGLRRRLAPAKLGLIAFLTFCLAVLVWDLSQGGVAGGLTAEAPVVNVNDYNQPQPALPVVAEPELAEDLAAAIYAAYRLDREQSRGEELALLQRIIDDPAGSPEMRLQAEQRRLDMAAAIEGESVAESRLSAQGFGETVVLTGPNQATVICGVELDAAKAAQIAEITSSACGVDFENVVIVNR